MGIGMDEKPMTRAARVNDVLKTAFRKIEAEGAPEHLRDLVDRLAEQPPERPAESA